MAPENEDTQAGRAFHETKVDLYERIGAIDNWIAAHDARINVLWERQLKELNPKYERKLTEHGRRINTMEKRIAVFSAVAAAVGGLVGTLLPRFISLLAGT